MTASVTIATSKRLVARVRAAATELPVTVVAVDAFTPERVAELRTSSPVVLAIVSGKEAAAAALAAEVDDVLEARYLDTLPRAVEVARQRFALRTPPMNAHRDRLAALGAVAAGIAHELSSPVSAVVVNLEHLRAELAKKKPSDVRQVVDDTLASMRVVLELVRELRALDGHSADAPPEVVDVVSLVRQVVRLTAPRNLNVELDDPDDVPHLWLPRTRLMQILTNLVANAVHAIAEDPRPHHRLRVSIRTDESALMIAISDTGVGIPPEDLTRVFDAYYTTKSARSGSGLGLPLSRDIVRALGGDLTLDSRIGEGTIAMVFLPLALRSQNPLEPAREGRRPRLLVVEGDPVELEHLERVLHVDFELLSAQTGIEALDLIASGARIDLVVLAPGLSVHSRPLAELVAEHAPALLARTVLLQSEPADGFPTVARAKVDDELVRMLESLVT